MRNLKKILALVLAMVMSLSLMATASAAETTAANDAATLYATAGKVLAGLNVVKGDAENPSDYRPNDDIIRAEAAALIYRVHTADVTDDKAALHDYTPFDDLGPVTPWAVGYISYAHNAGIVKGKSATKFDPLANITGYETLAMTLRALGYGKNGEFEGDQWRQNTARQAQSIGLFDGISAADLTEPRLNQAATRGFVFQVVFNALFLNQMGLSYTTTDLYAPVGTTMAKGLGLSEVTGVVVANQWANLEGPSVLSAKRTNLKDADGKIYSLADYDTELTDIGESRTAYLKGGTKVLDLADSGLNNVAENDGEGLTLAKTAAKNSAITSTAGAEHFINFGDSTINYSDWLIRYVVDATSTGLTAGQKSFLDKNATPKKNADGVVVEYTRTIEPGDEVTDTDLAIMEDIFSTADRYAENPPEGVDNYLRGEVYVGTSSLTDQSDIKSWKLFKAEYLDNTKDTVVTGAKNGEWLKIVDNDGDGVADYVLLTQYNLDEIVDSKGDTYYYRGVDITSYTQKCLDGYTPAVGDIVLYAIIDGTVQVHKAATATAAFKAVNYKDVTATTTDGEVKKQSGISNRTRLPEDLTAVNELVEYTLYLDNYDYVRAYSNQTSYALVTEVYPTAKLNEGWVKGRNLTAEVALAGENVIREYSVLNSYSAGGYNPFYRDKGWHPVQNPNEVNYLKPATNMLGMTGQGSEFIYTASTTGDEGHSWTNVAEYTLGEKGINLTSAAKTASVSGRVATRTDYIQLVIGDVSASNPLYLIDTKDPNYSAAGTEGRYVRAVDDTRFFVIDKEGTIRQWTGYKNTMALKAGENGIHAIYAVATDISSERKTSTTGEKYWVADVIVIEIQQYDWNYESIALIYSNDYKISGDVKYLQVLDSKRGEMKVVPNNVDNWNYQYDNYGFYGLRNISVDADDDTLFHADIVRIHTRSNGHVVNDANAADCAANGIRYGIVRSVNDEQYRSDYIVVDELDANDKIVNAHKALHVLNGSWSVGEKTNYNTLTWLLLDESASNSVKVNDRIVWVENETYDKDLATGFVVDIEKTGTPTWLWTIARQIANEPVVAAYDEAMKALDAAKKAADKANTENDTVLAAAIEAAYDAAVEALNKIKADTTKNGNEKIAAIKVEQAAGIKAIDGAEVMVALEAAKTALNEARKAALEKIADEDGNPDPEQAAAIEAAYEAALAALDEIMADETMSNEELIAAIEEAQEEGVESVNPTEDCDHVDEDEDGVCDICGEDMPEDCDHVDEDEDGVCDICGEDMPEDCDHVDENEDGVCDICGEDMPEDCDHVDEDEDGVCDKCGEDMPTDCDHVDEDEDGKCDICGEEMPAKPTITLNYMDGERVVGSGLVDEAEITVEGKTITMPKTVVDTSSLFGDETKYAVVCETEGVELTSDGDNYVFTATGDMPEAITVSVYDEGEVPAPGEGEGEEDEDSGWSWVKSAARTLSTEQNPKLQRKLKIDAGKKPTVPLLYDAPDSFKILSVTLVDEECTQTKYVWLVIAEMSAADAEQYQTPEALKTLDVRFINKNTDEKPSSTKPTVTIVKVPADADVTVEMTLNGKEAESGAAIKTGDKIILTVTASTDKKVTIKAGDADYTSGATYEVEADANVVFTVTVEQKATVPVAVTRGDYIEKDEGLVKVDGEESDTAVTGSKVEITGLPQNAKVTINRETMTPVKDGTTWKVEYTVLDEDTAVNINIDLDTDGNLARARAKVMDAAKALIAEYGIPAGKTVAATTGPTVGNIEADTTTYPDIGETYNPVYTAYNNLNTAVKNCKTLTDIEAMVVEGKLVIDKGTNEMQLKAGLLSTAIAQVAVKALQTKVVDAAKALLKESGFDPAASGFAATYSDLNTALTTFTTKITTDPGVTDVKALQSVLEEDSEGNSILKKVTVVNIDSNAAEIEANILLSAIDQQKLTDAKAEEARENVIAAAEAYVNDTTAEEVTVTVSGNEVKVNVSNADVANAAAVQIALANLKKGVNRKFTASADLSKNVNAEDLPGMLNTDGDLKTESSVTVVSELVAAVTAAKTTLAGYAPMAKALKASAIYQKEGVVVTLTESLTLKAGISIPKQADGKLATILDLNGCKVTFTDAVSDCISLRNGANLTIKNGTIEAEVHTGRVISVAGDKNTLVVGSDVTLICYYGVDESNDWNANCILVGSKTNESGVDVETANTTITVNGTLTGGVGVNVNGLIETDKAIKLYINGKVYVDDIGLYLAGYCTTAIQDGADIQAEHAGIEICNGVLNVSGGSIAGGTENPYNVLPVKPAGGSQTEYVGISVNAYNYADMAINILGGTVTGSEQLGLRTRNPATHSNRITVRYSNKIITEMPVFGEDNFQYEYWGISEPNTYDVITVTWNGPAMPST